MVHPAEEIGAAPREARVPYLLDASQPVGLMPVDVGRIECDMRTPRRTYAAHKEPGSSTPAALPPSPLQYCPPIS